MGVADRAKADSKVTLRENGMIRREFRRWITKENADDALRTVNIMVMMLMALA